MGWWCRLLRQAQALDDLAIFQVRLDDLIDVRFVEIGVPDAFRIDHDHRPFFAALQASGLIDTHFALACQPELLDALFGVFLQFLRTATGAALPLAGFALVQAEKNVMCVIRAHGVLLFEEID